MSDLKKLEKSLAEIDALAEEMLSKSEAAEADVGAEGAPEAQANGEATEADGDGGEVEKGLKPEDVSKDADDAGEKDDGDGDEDEGDDKGDSDKGDVKKSFYEEAAENVTLSKGFEVSEFLTEFTKLQGRITDSLRDDVSKSLDASSQTATILAKSFNAIMKSQNALAKSLADLADRLDQVERQPMPRKAVVNVMEKSFAHSAGAQEQSKELTKGEKLQKLTDLAMQGNQGVTVNDVVSYESVGTLRPELEALFKQN